MTVFCLKIIASLCMLIDHIGAVFPSYTPDLFRWIGRIAFPIYAYLVAEGCSHTKSIDKYMLRLGIFALISEIPFDLAFSQSYWIMRDLPLEIDFIRFTNVFYTLFLGVACVCVYEKLKQTPKRLFALIPLILIPFVLLFVDFANAKLIILGIIGVYTACVIALSMLLPSAKTDIEVKLKHKVIALIPALPIILLGNLLSTDYSMYGISMILILYLLRTKRNRLIALFLGITYEYGFSMIKYSALRNLPNYMMLLFALLAVAIIFFYNGLHGRKLKWAFYWFYPVHISALAFILILFVRPMLNGF